MNLQVVCFTDDNKIAITRKPSIQRYSNLEQSIFDDKNFKDDI